MITAPRSIWRPAAVATSTITPAVGATTSWCIFIDFDDGEHRARTDPVLGGDGELDDLLEGRGDGQ